MKGLSLVLVATCSVLALSGCSDEPKEEKLTTIESNVLISLLSNDALTFVKNYENPTIFLSVIQEKYPDYMVVNPLKISRDYQQNEIAADKQYKNKSIMIRGCIVDNIQQTLGVPSVSCSIGQYEIVGRPILSLKKDDETINAVANVRKGQRIDLFCKGDGAVLGGPALKNCVFPSRLIEEVSLDATNKVLSNPDFKASLKLLPTLMSESEKTACQKGSDECKAELEKTGFKVIAEAANKVKESKSTEQKK